MRLPSIGMLTAATLLLCSISPAKDKKKDPNEIGNRDVSKGINFYSIEKEIALGKQLAEEPGITVAKLRCGVAGCHDRQGVRKGVARFVRTDVGKFNRQPEQLRPVGKRAAIAKQIERRKLQFIAP